METQNNNVSPQDRKTGAFPPEIKLLLECSFPPSMRQHPERIQALLAKDLSWERILDMGKKHGLLPLLYRHLEGLPAQDVPEAVVSQLREGAQAVAMQNLKYTDELHEIFERFQAEHIRALPFKGPVLAATSYGSLSLRKFNDLDILVHSEDTSRAVDVLEARGYEWSSDAPRLDDSPLLGGPLTMPLVCEYQLERGEQTVEIRWRVGESSVPFGIDFETLWERRDTVTLAGKELPALDSLDRLLMLAYHGTKHRWQLLKWIADFAVSIRASDSGWRSLFRRARASGLERTVLAGIAIATANVGIGIPEWVDNRVRDDSRACTLAASVTEGIRTQSQDRQVSMGQFQFIARAADSPLTVLRMLGQKQGLHPSLFEYKLCPLPGSFHALYYPLVPVRLTAVKLRNAMRRVGII